MEDKTVFKRTVVQYVPNDMMVLDRQGNDYTSLEHNLDPEMVLFYVNERLQQHGLKVTLGTDEDLGNSNYYFFRIDKIDPA